MRLDALEQRRLLTGAPHVTAFVFDHDTAQQTLQFTFDQDVSSSLAASDLWVYPEGTDMSRLSPSLFTHTYNTATNVATFSYGPGQLDVGHYRASLYAEDVLGTDGTPMQADASFSFGFLWGDLNDDGVTDSADRSIASANVGKPNPTYSDGDLDGDGAVTQGDVSWIINAALTSVATYAQGLSLTILQNGDHRVEWLDTLEGEVNWWVQYSNDRKTWATVATSAPNTTSYTNTGIDSSKTYYYRVRATIGDLAAVHVTSTYGTPVASDVPAAPGISGLGVSGVEKNQVVVNWNEASGTPTYEVQQSTAGGAYGPISMADLVHNGDGTASLLVTKLPAETELGFRVRNVAGGVASAWYEVTTTTLAGPPAPLNSFINVDQLPHRLAITFDQPVYGTVSTSDALMLALPGGTSISLSSVTFSTDRRVLYANASLTPPTEIPVTGVWPEGYYELTVHDGLLHNAANQYPGDGSAPGDEVVGRGHFIIADLNGDGFVNFPDLLLLAGNYNLSGRVYSQGNINYDTSGSVNFYDLLLLASRYNSNFPTPPSDPGQLVAQTPSTGDTFRTVQLNWSTPSGTANYDGFAIFRSTNGTTFSELARIADPAETSFADTNLWQGKRYWYRIRTYKMVNGVPQYSYESNRSASTTLLPMPQAPYGQATGTSGVVKIGWEDMSSGESGFLVERLTNGDDPSDPSSWQTIGTTVAGATSITDSTVSLDTRYTYRISAVTLQQSSAPVLVHVDLAIAIPAALGAELRGPDGVALNWKYPTSARDSVVGFNIQRSADGVHWSDLGAPTLAESNISSDNYQFVDGTVSSNTTYRYRVVAVLTGGSDWTGAYSESVEIRVGSMQPTAPDHFIASVLSASWIELTWRLDTQAALSTSEFVLQRSINGGSWTTLTTAGGALTLAATRLPDGSGYAFTDSGLSDTASYQYRLAAMDVGNHQSEFVQAGPITTKANDGSTTVTPPEGDKTSMIVGKRFLSEGEEATYSVDAAALGINPNRLFWQVSGPAKYVATSNGDSITVSSPDNGAIVIRLLELLDNGSAKPIEQLSVEVINLSPANLLISGTQDGRSDRSAFYAVKADDAAGVNDPFTYRWSVKRWTVDATSPAGEFRAWPVSASLPTDKSYFSFTPAYETPDADHPEKDASNTYQITVDVSDDDGGTTTQTMLMRVNDADGRVGLVTRNLKALIGDQQATSLVVDTLREHIYIGGVVREDVNKSYYFVTRLKMNLDVDTSWNAAPGRHFATEFSEPGMIAFVPDWEKVDTYSISSDYFFTLDSPVEPLALAIDSEGRLLVAASAADNYTRPIIVRFKENESAQTVDFDKAFGDWNSDRSEKTGYFTLSILEKTPSMGTNFQSFAIAVVGSGDSERILFAGSTSSVPITRTGWWQLSGGDYIPAANPLDSANPGVFLARLTGSGELDRDFGEDYSASDWPAYGGVDSDTKPDGLVVWSPAHDSLGVGRVPAEVSKLIVDNFGRTYVYGTSITDLSLNPAGTSASYYLTRITQDGTLDPTFGSEAVPVGAWGSAGRGYYRTNLYPGPATGYRYVQYGVGAYERVAAPNAGVDSTSGGYAGGFALLNDNSLIISGTSTGGGPTATMMAMARVMADGSRDQSYGQSIGAGYYDSGFGNLFVQDGWVYRSGIGAGDIVYGVSAYRGVVQTNDGTVLVGGGTYENVADIDGSRDFHVDAFSGVASTAGGGGPVPLFSHSTTLPEHVRNRLQVDISDGAVPGAGADLLTDMVIVGSEAGEDLIAIGMTQHAPFEPQLSVMKYRLPRNDYRADGLIATATPTGSIKLRWSDLGDLEAGFAIERIEVGDPNTLDENAVLDWWPNSSDPLLDPNPGERVIVRLAPDTTTYEDKDVRPETRYAYRVFAYRNKLSSDEIVRQKVMDDTQIAFVTTAPLDADFVPVQTIGVPVVAASGSTDLYAMAPSVTTSTLGAGYYRVRSSGLFNLSRTGHSWSMIADSAWGQFNPDPKQGGAWPLGHDVRYGVAIVTDAGYTIPTSTKQLTDEWIPDWGPVSTSRDHEYAVSMQLQSAAALRLYYQDSYYLDNSPFSGDPQTPPIHVTFERATPSRPGWLSATPTPDGQQIDLQWTDNSRSEARYLVQRSTNEQTGFMTIATLPVDATSYGDRSISPNTVYYYRVIAGADYGNSKPSNVAVGVALNEGPKLDRPGQAVGVVGVVPDAILLTARDVTASADRKLIWSIVDNGGVSGLSIGTTNADGTAAVLTAGAFGEAAFGTRNVKIRVSQPGASGFWDEQLLTLVVVHASDGVVKANLPTVTELNEGAGTATLVIDNARFELASGGDPTTDDLTYTWSFDNSTLPIATPAPVLTPLTSNVAGTSKVQVKVDRAGTYQFKVIVQHGLIARTFYASLHVGHVLKKVGFTPVDSTIKQLGGVLLDIFAVDQFGQAYDGEGTGVVADVSWMQSPGRTIPDVDIQFVGSKLWVRVKDPITDDLALDNRIKISATISDGKGGVASGVTRLTILPADNVAPVIHSITATPSSATQLQLQANVTDDSRDDQLRYRWTQVDEWGNPITGGANAVSFDGVEGRRSSTRRMPSVTLPAGIAIPLRFKLVVADPSDESGDRIADVALPSASALDHIAIVQKTPAPRSGKNSIGAGSTLTLALNLYDQFGRQLTDLGGRTIHWSYVDGSGTHDLNLADTAGEQSFTVSASASGSIEFHAVLSGSPAKSASTTVYIVDAGTPVISIDTDFGKTLDADTPVRVSVTDPNPEDRVDYSLRLVVDDSTDGGIVLVRKQLSEGKSLLRDSVTTLKPTQLRDGHYTLVLQATDSTGKQSEVSTSFDVSTELKLGNFTLPVADALFNLPKMSFPVSRVYDSSSTDRASDFGPGWRLELPDIQFSTSADERIPASGEQFPGLRLGDVVRMTLPGGEQYVFRFDPIRLPFQNGDIGGIYDLWQPAFTSLDGKAQLLIAMNFMEGATDSGDPIRLMRRSGNSGDNYTFFVPISGVALPDPRYAQRTYNPADPAFGGAYTLKLEDGRKYQIDAATGQLRSMSDRFDHKLAFSYIGSRVDTVTDGVQTVKFERVNASNENPHRWITAIKWLGDTVNAAPRQVINYAYKTDAASGEYLALGSVTTPGNRMVKYDYGQNDEPRLARHLTKVTDPRDIVVLTATYDPATRELIKLQDSTNKAAETPSGGFNGEQARRTVTDLAGNETLYQYDARGNVTREAHTQYELQNGQKVRIGYSVIVRQFQTTDIHDTISTQATLPIKRYNRLLRESEPFFIDAKSNPLDAANKPSVWRISYEYDADRDVSVNVPYVNASGSVSDAKQRKPGGPTAQVTGALVTDLGNGNLGIALNTGIRSEMSYPDMTAYNSGQTFEQPVSMTDAAGNTTEVKYDTKGNVIASRNVANEVTAYSYNASGQVEHTYRYVDATSNWSNPAHSTHAGSLVSSNTYDANARLKSTTDELTGITRYFAYDTLGNQIAEAYKWDGPAAGDEVWVRSDTFYDDAGHVEATASAHFNLAAFNTPTDTGWAEQINVTGATFRTDDGYSAAALSAVSGDDPVTSHTTYDALGKAETTTDTFGFVTSYEYDLRGNLIQTTYADGAVTRTAYDAMNRPIWQSDRYRPAVSSDARAVTFTQYDDLGRTVGTYRYKDLEIALATDVGSIRKSVAPTPADNKLLSKTATAYDAAGRVESSTNFNDPNVSTDDVVTKNYYFMDLNTTGKLDAGDYYAAGRVVKTETIADGVTHSRETYYIDQITGGPTPGMRATRTQDEMGRWTTTVQDNLGRTVFVIEHGATLGFSPTEADFNTVFQSGDYLTETRYGYVASSNFGISNAGVNGAYTFTDSIERRAVGTSIDASMVTRRYSNKQGQLVAVAQPDLNNDGALDGVWKYEYDAYGNETKQIDPVNHITSFAYDSFGRRTSRTMPPDSDGVTANDTESWSFDANGQTKSHVDFMGQTTAYVYYAKSDGPTLNGQLHFEYRFGAAHRADAVVNGVVNASVASERSEYGYDTLGRPTTVTEYDAGPVARSRAKRSPPTIRSPAASRPSLVPRARSITSTTPPPAGSRARGLPTTTPPTTTPRSVNSGTSSRRS
ncbi:MAG: hypothetical protein QM770_17400 [Tepidisphaeraceae bacterium]